MKNIDIRPYTRQFYRGNGWRIGLALVQTALLTATNLMVAWLIQQILDLMAGENTGFTLPQLAWLTLASAGALVLTFACGYFSRPKLIAKGIGQYQEFVFRQLTQKSLSAFSGEGTSLYISALSNDAASIETGYLANFLHLLDQTVLLIGALVMMFWYSPALAALSVALSLLPIGASLLAGNRAAEAEKQVSDRNEAYISTLRDSLVGFSVIKSFRAEAQMCRIFARKVKEVAKAKEKRKKITVLIQLLSELASTVVQFGVFLVGAYLALSGRGVTVGTVLVFVQLLNYVLNPISLIPNYLAERKAAKALIRKLAGAIATNVRQEGTVEKHTLTSGIVLEDLSFAYEADKPVLEGINFTFQAGKRYAIVGASGSGKSTLLHLLMAAYPGYQGGIYLDGTELREINSEALYEIISVVQQNVFIFNASIRDNITMFASFPKAEVDRAIALSGLSKLIEERGEDYRCGENGSGLSGGERQRISIARSLLKKAQVLLVDEATAALDAQTAYQVSSAILDLPELTSIVVTHSLDEALLKRYDCILTLKNGRIAEAGSFPELMEKKGYFYSLYTVSQ